MAKMFGGADEQTQLPKANGNWAIPQSSHLKESNRNPSVTKQVWEAALLRCRRSRVPKDDSSIRDLLPPIAKVQGFGL